MGKLNAWIVNPYGTLPSEGWREYRSSMLASALAEYGYDVIWWISNYEHRFKKERQEGYLTEPLLPNSVKVYSVPSSKYSQNISLKRIWYEYTFGVNIGKLAKSIPAPDVIVVADPSLFYSSPIVKYARNVGCKVILDVLDLWPEQFRVILPHVFRRFERYVFHPLFVRRQLLVNSVDGVVAVTKDHLKAVNPPNNKPSLVAYCGLDYEKFIADSLKETPEIVRRFVNGADLVLVYSGTLGDAYDLKTLIEAVKMVSSNYSKIKFVFAGAGTYIDEIKRIAVRFPNNVLCMGMLSGDALPSIYKVCHIGICSYSRGSTVTMPIKLFDYLAGGLYVLYSLYGEIDDIMISSSCGTRYEPGCPSDLASSILRLLGRDWKGNHIAKVSELAKMFDKRNQHNRIAEFIDSVLGKKVG